MRAGASFQPLRAALAFLISVISLEFVFTALELAVPAYKAPVTLFPLDSEEIGIDLFGAVLPLFLCLAAAGLLGRNNRGPGRPFRGVRFWGSVSLSVLLTLLVFGYVQAVSGSLALPGFEAVLTIPVVEVLGIAYCVWRGPGLSALAVAGELYAIGVLGAVVGDLVRTLTGWIHEPMTLLVWGGGGLHDLVFWIGLYAAAGAYVYRETLTWLSRRLGRAPGTLTG